MSVPLPKDPLQALEICLSQVPHYHNAQRLQQDITFLFTQMRSALKPQVREFVSPTGDQVKLFFLGGTIPISYRNTRYNIPLTIYFDPPYPAQPPRCFVTPTNDMKIKDRHQHVDRTGMVYLPYLHSWNAYGSTITDLVGHMQQVFSEVPPVVATAKPQGQGLNNQMDITLGGGSYPSSETSQTGMSTQYGAGMNKNIWSGTESAAPKAPNASSHHSFSGYSQNTTMPSGMFANMQSTPSMSSTPQMQPGSVQNGQMMQQNPGQMMQQGGMMQPGMQQPGMQQPGMQQPGGMMNAQQGMQQPGMQQAGMQQPGMQQPGMQQPGMQQPGMQQPGMQQPGMQQLGMQQPGMQQPGMHPGMGQQPLAPGGAAGGPSSAHSTPHITAQSAPPSNVTPIQPASHTQQQQLAAKVTARAIQELPGMLRPVMESIQEQLDVSEQLAQHGRLCEDTEKSMSLEIEKQDRILQELRDTKAALENEIHKAEQDKELDVNEFLEPRDVLSRQLLDLIAEEAALDDMILHLEDCLKEKLLPADAWMQEVRDTVRRQFYVRELKKKVIRAVRARKVKVSLATSPREDALNSMRAGTIAS